VHVYPGLNPLFMAFAAGAMIFVSVHELLPMARRYGNIGLFITRPIASAFVYFVLGALI
jgi:zinc transporter ZupT